MSRLSLGARRRTDRGIATWGLHVGPSAAVFGVLQDGVPTGEFLRTLTRAQLQLFVDVSMLADGTVHKTHGQKIFYAETELQARCLEMACVLLGQTTNTTVVPARQRKKFPTVDGRTARPNKNIWRVCLVRRSDHIAPLRLAKMDNGFTVQQRRYTGPVWCPQTPDRTFFARRRGKVYVSMNSMEFLSERVQCVGEGACGAEVSNGDDIQAKAGTCDQMTQRTASRRFVDPVFLAGDTWSGLSSSFRQCDLAGPRLMHG